MVNIPCPHCSKTLLYGITVISMGHPSIQRNQGQPYVICDSCKRLVRMQIVVDSEATARFEVAAQQDWSPELAKSLGKAGKPRVDK
ncbi:MAG TPA: hypothetical protein VLB75_01175 [Steroidobacteraceae bacterium]|jgi:hypothetical protein|nr:hypothetical protein [Steroidobacteraceae bacterium]